MQGIAAHLEFLAVTGGMERTSLSAVKIGQFHLIHCFDYGVIGDANIVEGESPIDGVFQLTFGDARGDPSHFSDTDASTQPYNPG